MRVLIVTSVPKEAAAVRPRAANDAQVVISGIGRTNAAIATTRAILEHGPFDSVINAGIAGALPDSGLAIGDLVVASASIYFEEGLITPAGFEDVASLGFPLGDFLGNAVPGDSALLARAETLGLPVGRIATVATCSGTDDAAREVSRRTGAIAEAMEGAAVVHDWQLSGVTVVRMPVLEAL